MRAVGNANDANGLAIIISCHRIIGSQEQLVGYGGVLSLKISKASSSGMFTQS